jgi:hypothetical protein
MDKYIWAFIAPDKAVTFRVIEPLNRAIHFCGLRDANLKCGFGRAYFIGRRASLNED